MSSLILCKRSEERPTLSGATVCAAAVCNASVASAMTRNWRVVLERACIDVPLLIPNFDLVSVRILYVHIRQSRRELPAPQNSCAGCDGRCDGVVDLGRFDQAKPEMADTAHLTGFRALDEREHVFLARPERL